MKWCLVTVFQNLSSLHQHSTKHLDPVVVPQYKIHTHKDFQVTKIHLHASQFHWQFQSEREISLVSKGKSFIIFIRGQLIFKYGKDFSVTAVVTDSHVLGVCSGGWSCITHPATLDMCSLGRATFCHNTYAAQKPL